MDLNQLLYQHQIAVMRAAGQCAPLSNTDCQVDHFRRRVRESFVTANAPARNAAAWSEAVT